MGPKRVLSAEEIEARKKRRAEQERRRYAAKCGSERARLLARKREAERRRVAAMSPEERSEHLAQKREVQMRRYDAVRQQRIWAVFASLSVYCSTHGTLPVESTKAVQTEATGCFSGRRDVAVGTTIINKGVCQSTQTSPAAEKVHRWADTIDLDGYDSGPHVQGI